MDQALFHRVFDQGHIIEEVPFCDPMALFAPLADDPFALFLDSASARPGATADHQGRWSFIAADPFATLTYADRQTRLNERVLDGSPFAAIDLFLKQHAIDEDWGTAEPDLDLPPFKGGLAGFLGYGLAHTLERLPEASAPYDTHGTLPDMCLGAYDTLVAFDHARERCFILSTGLPETTPAARAARAEARTTKWRARIALNPALPPLAPLSTPARAPQHRVSEEQHKQAVQKTIDYILAGDIFQANIAQRFDTPLPDGETGLSFYRRLRALSPAPHGGFFNFETGSLLSSSPERFLQARHGKVETRPIKGTRPRGDDAASDQAFAEELLASEKDRAENVMIVDLLRNDLSRVCQAGSIQVKDLCALESFANVHHLVSTITGTLRGDKSLSDLLAATFPGGSITGAPKIRAMEIIAELEATARGPYCGALGYLGFDGCMDTNILIRSATIREGEVSYFAGGGIVAGSDPQAEYDETIAKASALRKALMGETDRVRHEEARPA